MARERKADDIQMSVAGFELLRAGKHRQGLAHQASIGAFAWCAEFCRPRRCIFDSRRLLSGEVDPRAEPALAFAAPGVNSPRRFCGRSPPGSSFAGPFGSCEIAAVG